MHAEPVELSAARIREVSGIDAIQAVIDGVLPTPPMDETSGFRSPGPAGRRRR